MLPLQAQGVLDIRVHRVCPVGSAVLLHDESEQGRPQIETEPYKVGLQQILAFEVSRRLDASTVQVLERGDAEVGGAS